jgi:penicillin-binding protein 1A
MTTIAKTSARRKNKKRPVAKSPANQQPRSTGKRIALALFKWGAILGLVGGAVAATAVALIFWSYGRDPNLPNIRSLADYEPKQVSRIAAADGTIIGELYTERRTYIPYEQVPDLVVHAFISAEDARFFEHEGLDYWGILRAFFVNVRSGKTKQGASTITQQVVKTFLLTPERTFKRKVQEIILARRLEKALSKQDILSLYINQIYFGQGRYGVHEAARYYFGKDVKDLNPGEAALLGGLPQSPERLSPRKPKNQERAKRRQKYVLEQMAHNGYLAEVEAQKWINEPIRIVREPFPDLGRAPEWVEVARQGLINHYGEQKLDSLGAEVVTTVDLRVQEAAQEALRQGLREYDARQKYGRPVRSIKPDKIDLEVARLARNLPKSGPERGTDYLAVVREVHGEDSELVVDLGKWKASVILGGGGDERFNPPDPRSGQRKKPGERFSAGDIVRVTLPAPQKDLPQPRHTRQLVELARGPQGAVVVMDPRSRRVLAMAGGYESRVADFNRATQARRQPGSTFKPFVYAAAIDSGAYTAASIVNDAPEVYDLWKPQNYKKGKFEGPVRLRYALAKSINTVAIRVLSDVGIARVSELSRAMGIQSSLPDSLSLALGSGEVTPLELTNAFATLAARGMAAPPRFIHALEGDPLPEPESREVLRPEVAYVMVDMMISVITEGTASKARSLDMPVSGKTGTSNDARDAWFMGLTPNYVVGVWIGFDDNRPLGGSEGGGTTALPVFIELMKEIGKNERREKFAAPEGIHRVLIDKQSGLLAPERAGKDTVYTEVFVAGTAPTETALAPDAAAASTFVQDEYEDGYGDDHVGGDGADSLDRE